MGLEYQTYEEALEKFSWKDRWELVDGNESRLNIAHECIDRHPANDVAIRIRFADGSTEIYKFGEFADQTRRFANYLENLNIQFGDKIGILLFPSIELYVSMMGTFRRGAVAVICFPLFGPEAINFRLEKSKAKALVTTNDMLDLLDKELIEKLQCKIILAEDLFLNLQSMSNIYEWNTDSNTLCMMQFSSGTTGEPKPLFYRHGAAPATAVTMKIGNGIGKDDVYFCPSSPGWGHGIWFGTIAPLMFGKAIGTFSGKFNPELVLETLQEWKVTSMAAISSHYRLLIEHPNIEKYHVHLKTIVSTGEKMAKETIEKIYRLWGIYPCVQYGSTEVGSISMDFAGIKNWKIKPGSLGRPMIGGMRVALLDENDQEVPNGEIGQVAIRKKSGWVKVGDSACADQDGYLWYVGRIDDVIISSGYTIGPIEVESVINQHAAVEESAVVASPDEKRGNVVKAYVVLKEGVSANNEIEEELKNFVKNKLSKHEYPRLIEFVTEVPKTPDGKLKRKVLREREIKIANNSVRYLDNK